MEGQKCAVRGSGVGKRPQREGEAYGRKCMGSMGTQDLAHSSVFPRRICIYIHPGFTGVSTPTWKRSGASISRSMMKRQAWGREGERGRQVERREEAEGRRGYQVERASMRPTENGR